MKTMNFIPVHRQVLRRQRRRRRIWTVVCIAYALPLIGLASAACLVIKDESPVHETQLGITIGKIEQTQQAIREARARLAPARAQLEATESISLRPDWSILLAHVARQLADDVFLSRVELNQPTPSPASLSSGPPSAGGDGAPFVVRVDGYGRTQTAVSDFVVQLEATPLFEKVTILQTDRRRLMADEAVSFELSCLLGANSPECP